MCCVFILGVPSPKPANQRFVRSGFPLQSFFVPQKGFPLQSFTRQHFLVENYATQRCKVSFRSFGRRKTGTQSTQRNTKRTKIFSRSQSPPIQSGRDFCAAKISSARICFQKFDVSKQSASAKICAICGREDFALFHANMQS
jgi:hypothetical protein